MVRIQNNIYLKGKYSSLVGHFEGLTTASLADLLDDNKFSKLFYQGLTDNTDSFVLAEQLAEYAHEYLI
jgi:hypothetical protein